MNVRNRPKTQWLLLIFAIAVVACGGSESDTSAAPSAASASAPTSARADSSESDSPKTLDDFLGPMGSLASGRGEFNEDSFNEQEALIEREVQRCMQEAGFEYTPGETGLTVFAAGADSAGLSDEDYAARNGFGISTSFDEITSIDIEFELPDAADFENMDPAEVEARNRALWGEQAQRFDITGAAADTSAVMTEAPGELGTGLGGCRGEAEESIRGGVEALAVIADQLDELDERIASDPRVAQMNRDWASCMRTAGFTYETRDEAFDAIQERFEPFLQTFFTEVEVDLSDSGEVEESGFGGTDLTEDQERELVALQDHERDVATASLGCEGDSAGVLEAVTAEYEAAFVENNREILEGLSR